MIIAIDIGNSSITIGCIDACRTYFVEHISTSQSKTDLEYAITIKEYSGALQYTGRKPGGRDPLLCCASINRSHAQIGGKAHP